MDVGSERNSSQNEVYARKGEQIYEMTLIVNDVLVVNGQQGSKATVQIQGDELNPGN